MEPSNTTTTFTHKNKALLYVAFLLFLAGLFLASAEFALRKMGMKPWQMREVNIQVEPGGRFFTKHPSLGYTHIPGQFKVTLGSDYSFQASHLPNTLRITRPLASYGGSSQKPEIWVFGCSFTYGWSLNDEQTYPWLLQERLPEYEIINFGVNGYGTTHSLIQLRQALESTRPPKVVVLAYADFHDERNTFVRMWRKLVAPMNKLGPLAQPYARLGPDGSLRYSLAEVEYTGFPLMSHSALVHFLEGMWNRVEHKLHRSHQVSEALVMEMASLARKHDVKFVLASIAPDRRMLEFTKQNGIPGVDISVDISASEYNNLPHDSHPSAIANIKYADKLEPFLKNECLGTGTANCTTSILPPAH